MILDLLPATVFAPPETALTPRLSLRGFVLVIASASVRTSEVAKVYESVSIPGVETVCAKEPAAALRAWPGQQLSLVCDASVHLLALVSSDLKFVHQAVWSESDFLSCMHHNHLANEIRFTARGGVTRLRRGRSLDSLSLLHGGCELPGLQSLRRRMRGGEARS